MTHENYKVLCGSLFLAACCSAVGGLIWWIIAESPRIAAFFAPMPGGSILFIGGLLAACLIVAIGKSLEDRIYR